MRVGVVLHWALSLRYKYMYVCLVFRQGDIDKLHINNNNHPGNKHKLLVKVS